jgi:hypothetical protein
VYCVPAGTTSGDPIATVNAVPEQEVEVLLAIVALGLTVYVNVVAVPVQAAPKVP